MKKLLLSLCSLLLMANAYGGVKIVNDNGYDMFVDYRICARDCNDSPNCVFVDCERKQTIVTSKVSDPKKNFQVIKSFNEGNPVFYLDLIRVIEPENPEGPKLLDKSCKVWMDTFADNQVILYQSDLNTISCIWIAGGMCEMGD